LFDLEADADRLVRDYSTGMRQALGLAIAWIGRPGVLVLDEPTSRLDPVATKRLRGFLTRLAADHGVTVFLSSHVLSEIEAMASRVGIIHKGRLLFQGELGALRRPGEGSLEDAFLQLVESAEVNGR
jgi:ABC-2 type transport system ATP-binding protein